jgi:hypothetical protein
MPTRASKVPGDSSQNCPFRNDHFREQLGSGVVVKKLAAKTEKGKIGFSKIFWILFFWRVKIVKVKMRF